MKVQGDGIMAVFGAPNPQEDHAVRACCAGLALQAAVRALPGVTRVLTAADIAKMTPDQQALHNSRPIWAVAAYALAVWGGNVEWGEHLKARIRKVAGRDIPVALASDAVVAALKALSDEGAMLIYQFSPKVKDFLTPHFTNIDHDMEWWNVPPAQLYWAWKD